MAEIIGGAYELHLTNSSDVLTKVLGLLTITPPSPTVSVVDATDQDSANVIEYIAGLVEPGEISGTVKYDPGSATDSMFKEHRDSRETRAFKIVVPKAASGSRDITGNLIITEYKPADGSVGDLQTAEFTAQISGSPSEADTA